MVSVSPLGLKFHDPQNKQGTVRENQAETKIGIPLNIESMSERFTMR